jgi:hypothetical protein
MRRALTRVALVAVLAATGCVSQAQFFDNKRMAVQDGGEPRAVRGKLSGGHRDHHLPGVVQPALQGPWVNGIQRPEFTIGVAGCGRRSVFVVVCPEGREGCFAAGPAPFHRFQ